MLEGYKTYIASGLIAVSGLILWVMGQIETAQFTLILGEAFGLAGIKHAITKK